MIFCYVEKVKISGCICFTIEYLSNKMNHCKKLQWFFYVIGNCCYVVVVRQEFRKKFLPKCVRWHALFVLAVLSIIR